VAVVEAEAGAKEPDPIFFLAGGPGQAASEVWPAVAPALARAARRRDVVVVDQRGTGRSARLDCEPERKAAGGDDLAEELDADQEKALARLKACGERLAKEHDLARFRSEDFARDLDLVRAALGAERIDLVGGSYGTRAALVYARLFPQRVRAMVLDGVAPLAMPVGAMFERDAARALEVGFARCRADAACRAAHPDPAGDLAALLAQLTRKPEQVTLRDPVSGARRTVPIDADTLRQLVLLLAYTPETVALVPPLLAEARRGDLAPITALGVAGGRDAQAAISRPLQLAVLCAEDAPFYPAERPAPGPFGETVRRMFERACAVFPHGAVDPSFRDPVRSDAPTLLLSGEADPVTPPSWAAIAAQTLPRSRQLTLAGQGHGTLLRGCMPRVIAQFLGESGQVEPLDPAQVDAACLDRVKPQPFFLDLAGPMP
jgi:pimeloyl-ACP methyl ester carboxylesterase